MLRVLLIMLGALLAASVDGAVVVLKNGDRVSGVIISRVDGVIQVESAILGTLRIPGNQVDRIEEEVPGECRSSRNRARTSARLQKKSRRPQWRRASRKPSWRRP
jgi:hypothetical protein